LSGIHILSLDVLLLEPVHFVFHAVVFVSKAVLI
jgi:hypothetical protein